MRKRIYPKIWGRQSIPFGRLREALDDLCPSKDKNKLCLESVRINGWDEYLIFEYSSREEAKRVINKRLQKGDYSLSLVVKDHF